MYKVTINNDGKETVIHSPYVNDLKLAAGVIKKEINKTDSFNIGFYLNNPAYGKIRPFKTLINVFNLKTGQYDFEGRILGPSKNMDFSGLFDESYECEGELGYLHDSQQKHREFRGSPLELLTDILNYHNSQVEDYKKFYVGNVTVEDPNDIYVYTSAEQDTYETIKDKLLDRLGGELQIRKENGVRYLDYLERVGEDKPTEIKLAKNLMSMSVDVDPTEIVTRLTPLGTRIQSEDETATGASEARLTIETVNNGIPYIDREDLIVEFGIQGGSVTWDDVTDPNNLLRKGQEWLANQKTSLNQYKVEAIDLFLIGMDIDFLDVGNSYPVKNPIMGIDERLRIIGKSIDINEPQNSNLTIGDKFKTLSEYQNDLNKSTQRVFQLESVVNSQTATIAMLKDELQQVNSAIGDFQQALEDADIDALNEALVALETAVENLQTEIENIPIYDLATPTQDGLMAAIDKAKLDLITITQSINLDNLKTKLDLLTVTQQIDLDQLYQDVQDLKNNV
jgi:hypothetical protein